MSGSIRGWIFALLSLTGAGGAFAQTAPPPGTPPVAELGAGMYRIAAEVADTFQARQRGLMQRRAMPLNHGMVFVFPEDAIHCMWMKNTYLPLSVAFIDADGGLINVADMQPQTEDSHCAAAPARFALEMNLGWFAARGIGPGARLRGFDRLPPAR